VKIALIQCCSGTDIAQNVEALSHLIKDAAAQGAKFIATPEMSNLIQRAPKHLRKAIRPEERALEVAAFAALAKELEIDLLIGSLALASQDNLASKPEKATSDKADTIRAVNRSLLFGPNGVVNARYDKIHLFDVTLSRRESWRESHVYDRGAQAVVARLSMGAKIGLSICYDLRFAKLYRHYAQAGADIITVPAAFTVPTGDAHWEVLLRARAIETGAYIVAPAQGGLHDDGRETWGHSMVVSPWGEVIGSLPHNQPGICVVDIDLSAVRQAREKIPAWNYDPDYQS